MRCRLPVVVWSPGGDVRTPGGAVRLPGGLAGIPAGAVSGPNAAPVAGVGGGQRENAPPVVHSSGRGEGARGSEVVRHYFGTTAEGVLQDFGITSARLGKLGMASRNRTPFLELWWSPRRGRTERSTLQLDAVCVVEQAAWDGVGLVGVADDGVPVGDGQLTGDEGRGAFGPVLDDLGEVAPLGVAQRCDHPIVDGEQVELREASQEPGVGAVAAADGELVQQSWHPDVACGEAAATGAGLAPPRVVVVATIGQPAPRLSADGLNHLLC